ncbi:hypothetical protein [uncultured Akkermansia sp.]|uniref:hypothetical protein n=1 Tax=uncultured Akkermansia sp. TaxID=512294 RepID=UPI0026101309|nr:hypothetical protein [uncultured Akkermansia sp.]
MISWPFFNQGEELSASKLRRLVKGCRELEQLAKSCRLQNGVGYTFNRGLGGTSLTIRPTGGRNKAGEGEPFTLKRLEKEDEGYKAYFWPGMVFEVHPGGVRRIKPELNGEKMDQAEEPPFLSVQGGDKVFLYLERSADNHDCITYAEVTAEEIGLARAVRIYLGEFKEETDEAGEKILKYHEAWSGHVHYAQSSLNEGWRAVVDTDEEGAPDMAYVKKGDIYIAGQLAQRGGGTWEVAPKEEGEIWLEVKCTGDGVITSAELKETKGSSKPLQYVAEPDDEEAEEEFTYCFLLAKVEKLEEPLQEDGNLPSLVSVKQYALGAVYCGVAPDELGLKAGKGIEIVDLADAWKKEIAALIEDAKEPSSGDYSLIYEEEEGAGKGEKGNKGKPYKFKLLCSSDGSVLLKEEDGRIYFSAVGKMPEAGDGLEYEKQQNGEGIEEETDILKIKIDSSVDSSVDDGGKWPVNLSVSPAGLKGELDLTVDTQKHDVGGGYKVGLSAVDRGTLSLEVTPGTPEESLSFRTPLRQNGKYVVLDYESSWSDAVNGVKAGLFLRNNKLAVELYADTEPDGSDNLISDSWTVLACDSDHAIRLHRDENGKIYIQQGVWFATSGIYSPIN